MARVVSRPSLLCSWAECVFLRNLGSTFLSDSCFVTRVSRCCLCAKLGTVCVWCGSWTWPCLQILKRLGAERPGRVVHRQWAHQAISMGWQPGEARSPAAGCSAPTPGTKKGTGGRSLSCVGRDGEQQWGDGDEGGVRCSGSSSSGDPVASCASPACRGVWVGLLMVHGVGPRRRTGWT